MFIYAYKKACIDLYRQAYDTPRIHISSLIFIYTLMGIYIQIMHGPIQAYIWIIHRPIQIYIDLYIDHAWDACMQTARMTFIVHEFAFHFCGFAFNSHSIIFLRASDSDRAPFWFGAPDSGLVDDFCSPFHFKSPLRPGTCCFLC